MITTVILDMDDTLYDEVEYCRSGYAVIAEFLARLNGVAGLATADDVFSMLWGEFEHGDRGKIFNTVLEKLSIDYDSQMILEMVRMYREHSPSIALPGESKAVLAELLGKYKLAMLTDGFMPAQFLKVKALEVQEYFDYIVYTEMLGREFWKPSTAGFEKILEKLGVEGENCVYVGDNAKKDFIGPNKLGMVSIQLVRSEQIHNCAPGSADAAPRHIITSLKQLLGLVKKL